MENITEKDSSKAKSAAFALKIGWENYMQASDNSRNCQSAMRKTAIGTILKTGYADASVYDSLEKSYIHNIISAEPDFEEINMAINALGVINTEKSAKLLFIFLQGLHQKKFIGTWGEKEKIIFPWIIDSLGLSKIKSKSIWNLLVAIYRTEKYTKQERIKTRDALLKIKKALI